MKCLMFSVLLVGLVAATSCESLDFNRFWTSDEINAYVRGIDHNYTKTRKVLDSWEHRDIWGVNVAQTNVGDEVKPIIVVDAGLRARDWVANMAALRLVKELMDNSTKSEQVDWFVLPNINPDGYEYTRSTDRNWIKNRRSGLSNASSCVGVSLNRNFASHWGGQATSQDYCSDYYAGSSAMSEYEVQALDSVFDTFGKRVKAYVSLQTAGAYILSPYFYTNETRPSNWMEQHQLGERMKKAIFDATGTTYENWPATKVFRTSGNSLDYSSVVKSVPYPFTFLLPNAKNGDIFEHTAEEIEPISKQVLVAMDVLGEYIGAKY